MTTQIHDFTTCTAGFNGQPCLMCHFAREFEKSCAKSPSEAPRVENQPAGFLVPEAENVSDSPQTQNRGILEPDFEREWNSAPRTHTRHTEQSEASYWFQRGLWAGIRYERERGLLAVNAALRK